MRPKHLLLLALSVALLVACRPDRPTSAPTPTGLPTAAQDLPTPTMAATATPKPIARPLRPTPTSPPASLSLLAPLPDDGPLPAIWTEVDLGQGVRWNPVQPRSTALDGAAGVLYILSSCEWVSLHEDTSAETCVTRYDLQQDRVLRTEIVPGAVPHGDLLLAGDALYLHHPWTGDLLVLDPETLAVRETIADVYGIAYDDGTGMTYAVTEGGLTRLGADTVEPMQREDETDAVAMAAGAGQVYVLGYDSLQVYDAGFALVADIPLAEGQQRSLALDAERGRLYVAHYDGLYVLDTATYEYEKAPAPIENARQVILAPGGARLYTFVQLYDWFGGTEVAAVDTETWEVETLYRTLSGALPAMALYEERLVVVSTADHALIPIDVEDTPGEAGRIQPRLPVGLQVIDVAVDAENERLYVSDSAGWIHILDRECYTELDRVYGGRELSLDATRGWLYAGDARVPQVTAFDAASLEPLAAIPQAGKPRANAATGEVVVVNRRLYVFDGATGEARGFLEPAIGVPADECTGCFYPVATDVTIDARRGLTATITYMPRPGKPGPQQSIAYDPSTGRAFYSLLTGGYVHMSSIATYPDLGELQQRADPTLTLEGLSGYIQLDPPAGRLYVVRGRFMYVLDAKTLHRIARVDAETWAPILAAVDEDLGRLYAPYQSKLVIWTREGGAYPAPAPHETMALTGTVEAIRPSPNYAQDQTLLATVNMRLCRSLDGGETWQWLRGGLPELGDYVPTLYAAFSPDYAEDSTVFVGAFLGETHGEGVYRSLDGGETWHPSSQGIYDLRVYSVVPSARFGRDGTVLAYARTQPGEAVYQSTDHGDSWELVVRQADYGRPPIPRPEDLLIDPVAGLAGPEFRCDFEQPCQRSTDGGQTWEPISLGPFEGSYLVEYTFSPHYERDGTVYMLAQDAVYRYDDLADEGEVCTDPPLYGPRDYTNDLTGIATAATSDEAHVLFVGSSDGEFYRFAPEELRWEPVGPAAATPVPLPPTPSPTPCAGTIDERFALDQAQVPRLGCPVEPAYETWAAVQPFELGRMFWLERTGQITVLQQDGTWAVYPDEWAGDPPGPDPSISAPEGLRQPIRGFGKVWRDQLGGPDAWIGWATDDEQGFNALVQAFARGTVIRGENNLDYILYDDGTWETK